MAGGRFHRPGTPHCLHYANGWLATPTATTFTVRLDFTPTTLAGSQPVVDRRCRRPRSSSTLPPHGHRRYGRLSRSAFHAVRAHHAAAAVLLARPRSSPPARHAGIAARRRIGLRWRHAGGSPWASPSVPLPSGLPPPAVPLRYPPPGIEWPTARRCPRGVARRTHGARHRRWPMVRRTVPVTSWR
jgi:hypothetical protein